MIFIFCVFLLIYKYGRKAMREYDVLIIGGSATGVTAAITAKRFYPDKKVLIIRREENVLIPCGIPYIYN